MRAFSLLFLLAMVACSKPTEPGHCFRQTDNLCVEYGANEAAAGKRMCGPSWSSGPCPNESLGTCTRSGVAEKLYQGAPNNYTPATAKSSCEFAKGTWSN